ncbi:hypothetical protein [Tateyamaria sp. ANG-S1]|uniref:hypothetical protein n=1 Tax=Tateyamaria sp. ANG-S1 TaxID=1577905 RepID=UPI00058317CD|nr:hypothetical protein [Tateyamaria sp. ANG-S1]KIC51553.1 hypothetical protein RA29_01770 [Tateyamaria sp. ANG-S1]
MTNSANWTLTGASESPDSTTKLDQIPVQQGFSWPAGQGMFINGTNFHIDALKGPNPIVTVGSGPANASNTCGIDLSQSTASRLYIVTVPPSPNGEPGPQDIYVTNYPGGSSPASTLSVTDAITYVPAKTSDAPMIPVIFKNNTGQADDQVWVQFLNGYFGGGQTGAGGTVKLSGNKGYSLADLTSALPGFPSLGSVANVSLNNFTNGRIYLNLGDTPLSTTAGNQPQPGDKSDPDYLTQYAYVELNVFGNGSNNMDISNIDFFSFTVTAATYKGGKLADQLTSQDTSTLMTAIKKVAPAAALVTDSAKDTVRVLGPGLASGYHTWSEYMAFLENQTTKIAGTFGSDQPYDLTASFDSKTSVVTLSGTINSTTQTTITIPYSEMNAVTGVYGANPSYSVNGGPSVPFANDIYGWIVGDLVAGMNWGFPGSSTPVPGQTGKTMGQLTSSEWFSTAVAHTSVQFSGAQSNDDFYNTYAAANQPLTEAYGFPFTDRLGGVLLYFPPSGTGAVDYLEITLS